MCAILAVMLVICLIGSEASAGIAACAVSVLVTFLLYLFTRKRTRKYAAIIAAAVFALVILSVCSRGRIFTDDGYYLEAVSINDNRIEPVSYTHLDVYKRQILLLLLYLLK